MPSESWTGSGITGQPDSETPAEPIGTRFGGTEFEINTIELLGKREMFEEPPSSHYGEIVPIRQSNSDDTRRPKKVPPAVAKLIADLGDRFPPTSQTDLESHARRLALLAQDLWDMPPDILAKAIDRYVKIPGSVFLPKAAQLVEIGRALCTPARQVEPFISRGDPFEADREESRRKGLIPLSDAECKALSEADPNTPAGAFFKMGKNQGWIVWNCDHWADSAKSPRPSKYTS